MTNLYIFLGQSNSRGAAPNADCHPSLSGAMTNIKMWNGTAFANFDVGVNQNYPTPDGNHGILPAFLYNEQARLGTTIYALNYAIGATRLADDGAGSDWLSTNSGELCDISKSTINNAIAYMWNTLNIRNINFIFIWAQGEADTTSSTYYNAYQTNLTNFINEQEANLAGTALAASKKYWILTKLGTHTTYDATGVSTINTAMANIAATNSTRIFTYDPVNKTLQVDGHHYEASGYKAIGEEMVTNITTVNNF